MLLRNAKRMIQEKNINLSKIRKFRKKTFKKIKKFKKL